jgi:hypothetical protein
MSVVELRVELPSYSLSFIIQVPVSYTILDVKGEIFRTCVGAPKVDGQRIIWKGRILNDEEKVEDLWNVSSCVSGYLYAIGTDGHWHLLVDRGIAHYSSRCKSCSMVFSPSGIAVIYFYWDCGSSFIFLYATTWPVHSVTSAHVHE